MCADITSTTSTNDVTDVLCHGSFRGLDDDWCNGEVILQQLYPPHQVYQVKLLPEA